MARKTKTGLPDALERREILAGERPDVDVVQLGDAYLAAGLLAYAADCYELAKERSKLEELKEIAVKSEPFLLPRLTRSAGVTPDDWRRAGEAAEASGRLVEAVRAFRQAGDEERAERLTERLEAFRAEVKEPEGGRWSRAAAARVGDTPEGEREE